jgi:hypothetical protein
MRNFHFDARIPPIKGAYPAFESWLAQWHETSATA